MDGISFPLRQSGINHGREHGPAAAIAKPHLSITRYLPSKHGEIAQKIIVQAVNNANVTQRGPYVDVRRLAVTLHV